MGLEQSCKWTPEIPAAARDLPHRCIQWRSASSARTKMIVASLQNRLRLQLYTQLHIQAMNKFIALSNTHTSVSTHLLVAMLTTDARPTKRGANCFVAVHIVHYISIDIKQPHWIWRKQKIWIEMDRPNWTKTAFWKNNKPFMEPRGSS